ncbi:MAG: GGDEF domain-containing protein [Eubacteriales bacterium]|nr:GGDEF domain-containing protein [Eubacteriales bacterium]
MRDFVIYYVESNVVCMIVLGLLLVHNRFNIDRQEKQVKFDRVLIVFMLYFLADSFWAAIVAEVIPKTRFTVVADVLAIYVLMVATSYTWLEFVMAVEQAPRRNRPINRFAVLFPFLVSTIALVLTYLFAPHVLLNENYDTLVGYSVFLIVVPDIYIVAILFYALRKAKVEENPIEKRKHFFIGFFPLLVIIGGLIQEVYLPHTPIYCFVVMIMLLIFYIQSLDARISIDPLTKLNNRGQLMLYISQKSNLRMEGRPTFVVMIDVNDFKLINDTYGHAEGDRALILIANSLRQAVRGHSMPIFLGRYGGDEFILVAHPANGQEMTALIREIREQIADCFRTAQTPYILSAGIGSDELMAEPDSFAKCQQRADQKLYLDKKHCKMQRQSAAVQA